MDNFCDNLNSYTNNPKNDNLGEHDHFGPYFYLKIMTSTVPEITAQYIAGTLEDLKLLAKLVRSKLMSHQPGDKFIIHNDYSPTAKYRLQFVIMEDGYDPSDADSLLNK